MDKTIENLFMQTSMEAFLRSKLREQENINERLATTILEDGAKLTPEDIVRFKEIKSLVNSIVLESLTKERQYDLILKLSCIIKESE